MERDATNVLAEYVRICNNNSSLLQHYLASNSALEWFGRTIRGRINICSYYRFDLCEQYEHVFQKAERCDAIETKPLHIQTKTIVDADKADKVALEKAFEVHLTPSQRISTPTLPKVGKEKTFLITPEKSPEICSTTPSPKSHRISQDNDDEPPIKRSKLLDLSDDSLQELNDLTGESSRIDFQSGLADNETDDVAATSINEHSSEPETGYTNLMYLESIGFLHNRPKQKHRGLTSSTGHPGDGTTTDSISPTTSTNLDLNSTSQRKTKLKLSYRIRLHDNQLQFALIIYEHLASNPKTRRNLMKEFHKVTEGSKSNSKTISSTNTTTIGSAQKSSLKRSLRLL